MAVCGNGSQRLNVKGVKSKGTRGAVWVKSFTDGNQKMCGMHMDTRNLSVSETSNDLDLRSVILTACAVSLLLTYVVYARDLVLGTSAGNWVYPYLEKVQPIPLWIPVATLLFLGFTIFLGSKWIQIHEVPTLAISFLSIIFIQVLLHKVYAIPLSTVVESNVTNGFYTAAMRFSALEILTKFNELLPQLLSHAKSNMPGKILLFEFFKVFTSSPRIMGYMVLAVSSLGALLLYGICKRLFRDQRAAYFAFILYALIPGRLFFLPILNTVTPVFILLCLYLFLLYCEKKHWLFAGLLGIALYFLVLFEASPLTTGIIFTGILIYELREKRLDARDVLKLCISLFLAFVVTYAMFSLVFGFQLFPTFLYMLRDAAQFNSRAGRAYFIWLGENIKDFFFGAGLPVMILYIYLAVRLFSDWAVLKDIRHWSMENIYIATLLVTLVVVDLLGINRGEVMRLWIYLAVFFQIPAALLIARVRKGEVMLFLVSGILVLQTVIFLQRVGFVLP